MLGYDAVWRDAGVTTEATLLGAQKNAFPRGRQLLAVLNAIYSEGWRLVVTV